MWPTLASPRCKSSEPERSPSARTPRATASVVVNVVVCAGIVRTGLLDASRGRKLGEHRDRAALGFADRLRPRDVVLPLDLKRQRPVRLHSDPVEIVAPQGVA